MCLGSNILKVVKSNRILENHSSSLKFVDSQSVEKLRTSQSVEIEQYT